MRDYYNKELEQLKTDVIDMGGMCTEIVSAVLDNLENYRSEKEEETVTALNEISRQERAIETNCMRLIMRNQPIARDLRRIRSSMFIIYDMERIGIQSAEIAHMLDYVAEHPQATDAYIFDLGKASVQMTKDAVAAFEAEDEKAALAVIAYDDVVDEKFDAARHALISAIHGDDADAESSVDMLMIAKYYERIADHAESIARWVYFSKTGDHAAD